MRARRLVAAATAAAAVAAVSVVPPAQAGSCIVGDLSPDRRTASLTNTCGDTRRVKIFWTRATDTACTQLTPGEKLTSSRSYPADFAGWEYC